MDSEYFFILDDQAMPIARAVLESAAEEQTLQMRLLDGPCEALQEDMVVQLISMGQEDREWLCRLRRVRDARLLVDKMKSVEGKLRRELRIACEFESYLYPVDDSFTGRYAVTVRNLSCGGVAFSSAVPLPLRQRGEIVVALGNPLLLPVQLIREDGLDRGQFIYGAKFIDLIPEEESMVRERVFGIQLRGYSRKATIKQ